MIREILRRLWTLIRQRPGVGYAPLNVLLVETLVKRDGGSISFSLFGHIFLETTAQRISHL